VARSGPKSSTLSIDNRSASRVRALDPALDRADRAAAERRGTIH
jgi:hypothetical protein